MSGDVSALELFGTEEPLAQRRRLMAGPLRAVLEDGNLRDIRFGGVEVVRAINYLARDKSWGTSRRCITNLEITQDENAFAVDYDGLCGEPGRRLRLHDAHSRRSLGPAHHGGGGEALADFLTNRTGFVDPACGRGCRWAHGTRPQRRTREETFFPERSAPTSRPST